MTAVGLFAGRGDVVLAMGLAVLVGIWLGWQAHRVWSKISSRKAGTR